jgi:hypothetical protein
MLYAALTTPEALPELLAAATVVVVLLFVFVVV